MRNKNFINFHVLISHSPSCLNRDDMNMQKTAIFGGVTRVRVSSQSLKRAIRMSDYYRDHVGQPAVRTRELETLIPLFTEQLTEFSPEIVTRVMTLFVRTSASEKNEAESDEDGVQEEKKKLAVAPWVLDEIRVLCGLVADVELTTEEVAKINAAAAKQKGKKKKTAQTLLDEALLKKCDKLVSANMGLVRKAIASAPDIALSGRMATSGLMTSVDGALAMAHAITTHAVEPQDVDWFTAVDDLVVDTGGTGSGHLATQQFSSGVFYRYASLNLKQLQVNLGLLADINSQETPETREKALSLAKHLFHMLATVVPSAKQQTFAAHNLADFAIVSFSDQPISLANAFEKAIQSKRESGFLSPSVDQLAEYWTRIHEAYALDERAAAFSPDDVKKLSPDLRKLNRLPDMEDWISRDGQD